MQNVWRWLSGGEKGVWVALRFHVPNCRPGLDRICELSGMGITAVQKALGGLESVGLIARDRVRRADGTWRIADYGLADMDDERVAADIGQRLAARGRPSAGRARSQCRVRAMVGTDPLARTRNGHSAYAQQSIAQAVIAPCRVRASEERQGEIGQAEARQDEEEAQARSASGPVVGNSRGGNRVEGSSRERTAGSGIGNQVPARMWGRGDIRLDCGTGRFVGIGAAALTRWRNAFPALDMDAELARAGAWCLANPTTGRKRNYERFIVNWLLRVQDGSGSSTGHAGHRQGDAAQRREQRRAGEFTEPVAELPAF